MIEQILDERGQLMAMIVRAGEGSPGVDFFTPPSLPLQVGRLRHPAGHIIQAHSHNCERREINQVIEVLIVRKGRLAATFHDSWEVQSAVLNAGDILIHVSGGHGFEVLEDCDVLEVKQGPHLGEKDKMRLGLTAKSAKWDGGPVT